jgi:SnoaL-like protein
MDGTKTRSSRRAFFLQSGAALGTGLAATAGAAVLENGSSAASPRLAEEREAIRRLTFAFMSLVERQQHDSAAALFVAPAQYRHTNLIHGAYRQNVTRQQDTILISADGLRASATTHVEVEVSTPLAGDSTLVQMARLQGNVAERHWESGRFEAQYMKTGGQWKMTTLNYLAT